MIDAVEVPVEESNERWTDLVLQDGTHIRLKSTVISAARLENEYDQNGIPVYVLNATPVMVITEIPDSLKKKKN